MRLDAEHDMRWRHRLLLGVALATLTTAACTKTWVLGPAAGEGGAGGTISPAGSGGFTFPGSGGFFGGDHGGASGHAACTPSPTPLNFDIPTASIMFLVGRDASMTTKLNGTDSTRMAAVQSQLKTLINNDQYAVRFGYLGFPSMAACPSGMACCVTSSEDGNAPPQIGAAFSIIPLLTSCAAGPPMTGCTSPNDARPVAQALQTAESIFSSPSQKTNGDRSVVLIIDGAPGCPDDDPSTKCFQERQWVATLSNESQTVHTYVIAIGDDAQGDTCLPQIAGAGSSTAPSYVGDIPTLAGALNRVISPALAAACTVELAPGNYDPTLLSLRLSDHDQDHEIPFDMNPQHDGWNFVGQPSTRIKINGSYCASLQTSSTLKVRVLSGCPPCTNQAGNCD